MYTRSAGPLKVLRKIGLNTCDFDIPQDPGISLEFTDKDLDLVPCSS